MSNPEEIRKTQEVLDSVQKALKDIKFSKYFYVVMCLLLLVSLIGLSLTLLSKGFVWIDIFLLLIALIATVNVIICAFKLWSDYFLILKYQSSFHKYLEIHKKDKE